MAEIELVIKIPEEQYRTLNAKSQNDVVTIIDYALLIEAIKNGIPLPKGRGRLLVLDERCVNANSMKIGNWSCQKWISEVGISNSVVTIIEADKEEKQDEVM